MTPVTRRVSFPMEECFSSEELPREVRMYMAYCIKIPVFLFIEVGFGQDWELVYSQAIFEILCRFTCFLASIHHFR